ncbi:MAG TPA: response regulator [Acetobacteraceae bacterium]|nr:response regulator [Acetobacteraceae bacterium]
MSEPIQIMLVEDNQDDYEATLRSLKKNHFMNPIEWCRSGQEALDHLHGEGDDPNGAARRNPDLILLDLNMPGIDGRHVLETIKKDSKLRSIPVVVLTTSTDSRDIEACYAAGANSYIQKPVSFDGLTAAIRTMKDYWFGVAILPPRMQPA